MSARCVVIHCARGVGEDAQPLRVHAEHEFPEHLSLDQSLALQEREAEDLAHAIFETLPGGTVDRLAAALLRRVASSLVVPHRKEVA